MKRLLYLSLFFNLLALGAAGFAVHRLGGFRYVLIRLQHSTEGLHHHRVQHFERLPERTGSIIFLGDSQTEQAEWHEIFAEGPVVLNRGISGDYTEGLLERLPEIFRHKPLKIFLLIGINDLVFGNSVPEIEMAYRAIVKKIRTESPDTELYLQSVLPVNNGVRKVGAKNEDVLDLNAHIIKIAHDFTVPFLDIATPLKDADGNMAAKFTEDGMHLNGLGYLVWKKEIEKFVQEK
ncbi:MAG: GDSL-type esterase/lipase family protein [Saprospiraceae bacterium]|nr:GDSL-type esterase/lipase family protein [Saprospiraceae bacterium]